MKNKKFGPFPVFELQNSETKYSRLKEQKLNLKSCSLKNQKVGGQSFKKRFQPILNYVLNSSTPKS